MIRGKIDYKDLNAKQKEAYNFQKVSSLLADYGYLTIKLADDYRGADFLALEMVEGDVLKVQLKSRLTLDKKYMSKGIYITFKDDDTWFIIKHDDLVTKIEKIHNFMKTESWLQKGCYHFPKINKDILKLLQKYKL